MNFKYIVAIVRPEDVPSLETSFIRAGVGGLTLAKVRGFGEYRNYFTNDILTDHVKLEILAEEPRVQQLLDILREVAGAEYAGAGGIVAVMPVDVFLHLRSAPDSRTEPPVETAVSKSSMTNS